MALDHSDPDAVVRRYYLFRAMDAVGFISPVFALFVLRDVSYAGYGTLSAVYSLLLVGGEIPTGYVGDRVGRRDTLVVSKLSLAASLYGFVLADSYASYLLLYVLWGAGMALTSGTGSAWLYETLEATLGSDQFTAVQGKGNAIARWSAAVTTILGSLLYTLDPTYPFLAAGTLMTAGAGVIATLPRTEQFANGESAGPDPRAALGLLRERVARPPLRSFVLYVALLFGVVGAAAGYIQPAAVEVADSVAVAGVDVDDTLGGFSVTPATGLGPLYASFAALAAVLSYYADPIESRIGLRGTLVVTTGVVVVSFVLPLVAPLAAGLAFYVVHGTQHLLKPMVQQYVNDRVDDVGRATVLSAVSMAFGLARTPFVVLAGFAAGAVGPVATFGVLAALFVATALPLALLGSPLPERQRADRGATTPG